MAQAEAQAHLPVAPGHQHCQERVARSRAASPTRQGGGRVPSQRTRRHCHRQRTCLRPLDRRSRRSGHHRASEAVVTEGAAAGGPQAARARRLLAKRVRVAAAARVAAVPAEAAAADAGEGLPGGASAAGQPGSWRPGAEGRILSVHWSWLVGGASTADLANRLCGAVTFFAGNLNARVSL